MMTVIRKSHDTKQLSGTEVTDEEGFSNSRTSTENEVTAASKILRFWLRVRKQSLGHLILDLQDLRVSSDYIKKISFSAMVRFLREKGVIRITRLLLHRILYLAIKLHGYPPNIQVSNTASFTVDVNVRVFLATYMIVLFPSDVFEESNQLVTACQDSAKLLLQCFEDIIQQILSRDVTFRNVDYDLRASFAIILFDFMGKFNAWKVPDEAKLICRIKHALIALYNAESHLPHDEPVDSKLKLEFRTQIERFRTKLQQIAGVEALETFDAQQECGVFNQNPCSMTSATTLATSSVLTNEQLAHELLLDPNFIISGDFKGCNGLQKNIKEAFNAAFWASLVDDMLLEVPYYGRVLRVLCEVRDFIADLGMGRFRQNIYDVIDIELIQSRIAANALHWQEVVAMVSDVVVIVTRLHPPARVSLTEEKWCILRQAMQDATDSAKQPVVFCKALEFLLNSVEALRIDEANSRLRCIAPVIKDHGIEYEKGRFEDRLTSGEITLLQTEAWIKSLVEKSVSQDLSALELLESGNAKMYETLICTGFYDMLLNSRNLDAFQPETFQLDFDKLSDIMNDIICMVLITTLLVGTCSVTNDCLSSSEIDHGQEGSSLSLHALHAKQITESIGEKIKDCDLHNVKEIFKKALEIELSKTSITTEGRESIIGTVSGCCEPGNVVYDLLERRVLKVWNLSYSELTVCEKDMADLSFGKVIIPRIAKTTDMARRIIKVNLQVHGGLYNRLILEAVGRVRSARQAEA